MREEIRGLELRKKQLELDLLELKGRTPSTQAQEQGAPAVETSKSPRQLAQEFLQMSRQRGFKEALRYTSRWLRNKESEVRSQESESPVVSGSSLPTSDSYIGLH